MDSAEATMLKERLATWTDFDLAEHAIGACLGLVPPDATWATDRGKGVFWSANPLGDFLSEVLRRLVDLGAVEENDAGQFRCSAAYAARASTDSFAGW